MSSAPPPPPPPPAAAPPPPPAAYRPVQDHPRAVVALVLGIIGLVTGCAIVSPIALVLGRNAMKEIDASEGTQGGRGMAQAGFILGIIGTVILGLAVLSLLILIPVSISVD